MTAPSAAEVQRVLATAYDGVRVVGVEPLGPWALARCRLTGAAPPTVVVKWLRSHPTGFRTDPAQLLTEIAALRFVDGLGLAPRLLAYDGPRGVVVLEDLAPRQPLDALTRRDGYAAWTPGRRELVRLTARLHAETAGREAEFLRIRESLGPFDAARRRLHLATGLDLGPLARKLAVPIAPAAARELADLRATLTSPGRLLAFSSGDQGDNNVLVREHGDCLDGRLIDFEFAGFHHALLDVAWIHIPPPRWITVADPAAAELEELYRRGVADAFPQLADDTTFDHALTVATVTLALERLGPPRLATLDARAPGDDSRVQMVATYEAAADLNDERRRWPGITGWLRRAAAALRRRWPDADVDLASYQPYTARR